MSLQRSPSEIYHNKSK